MKAQEMNQDKLLAFMKTYLEGSVTDLNELREKFYDAVTADDKELAASLLREIVVKQAVHAMLLEELADAEEYYRLMSVMQKMSKDAPEA